MISDKEAQLIASFVQGLGMDENTQRAFQQEGARRVMMNVTVTMPRNEVVDDLTELTIVVEPEKATIIDVYSLNYTAAADGVPIRVFLSKAQVKNISAHVPPGTNMTDWVNELIRDALND